MGSGQDSFKPLQKRAAPLAGVPRSNDGLTCVWLKSGAAAGRRFEQRHPVPAMGRAKGPEKMIGYAGYPAVGRKIGAVKEQTEPGA